MPKLAMKIGRHCCHQLLFQTHLHALFKTANFVMSMKFKGLEQQNSSTDSDHDSCYWAKIWSSVKTWSLSKTFSAKLMPFFIFRSFLNMKW